MLRTDRRAACRYRPQEKRRRGKVVPSGAIAGFVLELLAVRVTDIYHYNPEFWLNLGGEPYQFPVFGGLMWGGLTVCGLRIARRLGFGKVMTALVTGFLIVSMDLLLDVVAIRLDGGFFAAMYLYCLAAIIHLGIAAAHPWTAVLCLALAGGTIYLAEGSPRI